MDNNKGDRVNRGRGGLLVTFLPGRKFRSLLGQSTYKSLTTTSNLLSKRVLIWWSEERHCIKSVPKQWRKKFTDRILLIDQYWVLFRFNGRLTACFWHLFLRIIAASEMWSDEFYLYIRQWHSSRKLSLQLQTKIMKTISEIH